MLSAYLIFLVALLLTYFLGLVLRPAKYEAVSIDLQEVSVVIPFRNESQNLGALLRSIAEQKRLPKEFIFVNDHSEDNFLPLFEPSGFQILHLEAGFEGKKAALKTGILQARGNYILTLDADVRLNPDYFEKLGKIAASDLIILSVKMKSKNLTGLFAALDFYFLNALNTALTGIAQPIVANGANLLFRKNVYFEMLAQINNQHIASGDDQFLLQAVRQKKGKITLVRDDELAVETFAPLTFSELLHQRLRWIGKTKQVKDSLANLTGFLGIIYHLSGLVIVAFHPGLYWILFLKALCDLLVLLPHLIHIKQALLVLFSPVFTLVYPFYLLLLAVVAFVVKPMWKNRKVDQ